MENAGKYSEVSETICSIHGIASGEDYTTISCVILIELQRRFAKYIVVEFPGYDPTFAVATLVDPRYRLLLNPQQVESAKTELLCLMKDHSSRNSSSKCSSPPIEPDVTAGTEPFSKQFVFCRKN